MHDFPLSIYALLSPHSSFFLSILPSPPRPPVTACCHPPRSEFTASITTSPCSCGTSAFRVTLQFFRRPCFAFGVAGVPVQGEQQLREPRHHLGLDSQPLQAARKARRQLQPKPDWYWLCSFKLPPCDTAKLNRSSIAQKGSTAPHLSFLVQWGWFGKRKTKRCLKGGFRKKQ